MSFYDTLVYVCSPISVNDESRRSEESNLECGVDMAKALRRLGVPCFSPHLYTPVITYNLNWVDSLNYDLAVVRRCAALLTGHGWESSKGCLLEVAMARAWSIPVFHDFRSLMEFLSKTTGKVNYASEAENASLQELQSRAQGTETQEDGNVPHWGTGIRVDSRRRMPQLRVQARDASTEGEVQ